MALSDAFLRNSDSTERSQQAEKHRMTLVRNQDKEWLDEKTKPITDALSELAKLSPDKDGYHFVYSVDYKERGGRIDEMSIHCRYQDARGKNKKYGTYPIRSLSGEYLTGSHGDLTSSCLISVEKISSFFGDNPPNVLFKGYAWDKVDFRDRHETVEIMDNPQQIVDSFLASWVGRNIPDVTQRLQTEPPKETSAVQPQNVFKKALAFFMN